MARQKTINLPDIDLYAIEATHGDTLELDLSLTDGSSVLDITGWGVFFTIKLNREDPDVDALVSRDAPFERDDAAGTCVTGATAAETAALVVGYTYVWDVQLVSPSGGVMTVAKGTYKPTWGATDRVA